MLCVHNRLRFKTFLVCLNEVVMAFCFLCCYCDVEGVKEVSGRLKGLEAEDHFIRKGLVDPSAFYWCSRRLGKILHLVADEVGVCCCQEDGGMDIEVQL